MSIDAATCPRCVSPQVELARVPTPEGLRQECPRCGGEAISVTVLSRLVSTSAVRLLLGAGADPERRRASTRGCPWCRGAMQSVDAPPRSSGDVEIDVCPSCQLLWFDPGELHALPIDEKTPGAAPRPAGMTCETCGAPARPDLDATCEYCGHRLASVRVPVALGDVRADERADGATPASLPQVLGRLAADVLRLLR